MALCVLKFYACCQINGLLRCRGIKKGIFRNYSRREILRKIFYGRNFQEIIPG